MTALPLKFFKFSGGFHVSKSERQPLKRSCHTVLKTPLLASLPLILGFSSSPLAAISWSFSLAPHPLSGLLQSSGHSLFLFPMGCHLCAALWLTRCTVPSSHLFKCHLPRKGFPQPSSPERPLPVPCHCVMLPSLLPLPTLSLFVNLIDLWICFLVCLSRDLFSSSPAHSRISST